MDHNKLFDFNNLLTERKVKKVQGVVKAGKAGKDNIASKVEY